MLKKRHPHDTTPIASVPLRTRLKSILPNWLINYRNNYLGNKYIKRFSKLTVQQAFATIYTEGCWGRSTDPEQLFYSGTGSHDTTVVSTYVEALREFLSSLDQKPNVVDLGCGDFSVGSKLRPLCANYVACDIVESLISWNKQKYQSEGVDFRVLDIIDEELPEGDIVFIRQVFQHLSNAQILKVLPKVTAKYKYLVLTEDLPLSCSFVCNIDKSVGPDIRLRQESGIILTRPPFNLQAREDICLCEAFADGGVIRTNAYRLA